MGDVMQLKDVRAIVTGAASGLGAATAAAFRDAGATVTIADRDADAGAAQADAIGAGFVAVDVTDEWSAKAAIDTAAGAMGDLDVLVNCAGIAIG